MKKITIFIMVMCFLCLNATSFAARYNVPEGPFSIELEKNFAVLANRSVITSDMEKAFGEKKAELAQKINNGLVYLFALDKNSKAMFHIMLVEDESFEQLNDLRKADKETIQYLKTNIIPNVFAQKDIQVSEVTEYANSGAKYIVAEGALPVLREMQAVSRMFVTIKNGKMVMFALTYLNAPQFTYQEREFT